MPDGNNFPFEEARDRIAAVVSETRPAPGAKPRRKLPWRSRLRRWLRRQKTPAEPILADDILAFLTKSEAQAFAEKLDEAVARTRAREDAARHHPPAESVNPNDAAYCASILTAATFAANHSVFTFRALLGRVVREAQKPLPDLRRPAQNRVNRAVAEIGAVYTLWEPRIVRRYLGTKMARAKLEKWIREQGVWLDRLEPRRVDWRWAAVVILAGFIAETWGNVATLKDSVATGWLGALQISLGIAAVSIGSGLAVGVYFGRLRHHAKAWVRRVGWTGTISAGLMAAVLIYGLAAARDEASALKTTFDDAVQAAGTWAISHPVSILLDLKSDVLWLVGLGTWIFALFEGVRCFADPYFGFSTRWRDVLAIEARHDEDEEAFESHVEEIVEEAREALDVIYDEARAHADGVRHAINLYERLIRVLAGAHGVIYQAVHRALRWYADENAYVRQAPSPSWFGRTLDLSFEWPEPRPDALDSAVGEASAQAEAAYAAITVAREDLERAHRDALIRMDIARKATLGAPAGPPEGPLPPPTGAQIRGGF